MRYIYHSFNFSGGLKFFKIRFNCSHEVYVLKRGRKLTIEQMHEQNNFWLLLIMSASKLLKDIVDVGNDAGIGVRDALC